MTRRRLLLALPLGLVLAYAIGFAWFLRQAAAMPDLPGQADAIVVLTGGPDRIEAGLRLLVAGRAPRLLISGLGGGATLAEPARRAGLDPAVLAGRVTLGRRATTTRTNAEETAQFVADHDLHSLILVTAGYHMPRALLELGRAVPGVSLYPAPVPPREGRGPSWRLLMEEYSKWLLALAGASRYGPVHAPARPPGTSGANLLPGRLNA